MEPVSQSGPDLSDYLAIVRRRKWTIVAVMALVVGSAIYFSVRQTPIYQAEARVLVKPIQQTVQQTIFDQAPNLVTERQLIMSQVVAGVVQKDLGGRTSVSSLLGSLKVDGIPDSSILVITYDDPSPSRAAGLANAFAQGYIEYRTQQTLDQFQAAATVVQRRINTIKSDLTAIERKIRTTTDVGTKESLQSQRDTLLANLGVLQQRLLDLQPADAFVGGVGEIVQRADVPGTPVSPNLTKNVLLAIFAGLALGLGLAFLKDQLDDRVKSRKELELELGAPVIGAVPAVGGWRKADEARLIVQLDPRSPVSEAYRTLATNIQYIGSQRPMKVLLVTSAVGSEGKTTTASNLAVVLAQAGKRVILVSADMRRPRLHRFFDMSNETGLSAVLSDSMSIADVIQTPDTPNLRILTSGAVPSNPAELLASRRATEMFVALRGFADLVIVDTPPMLAVADASILAPLADGTLLVINASRAGRAALEQVRDQLGNAGAEIIGAVYNNFDPEDLTYPYYYKYYYQYYGTEDGAKNGDSTRRGGRKARKARKAAARA